MKVLVLSTVFTRPNNMIYGPWAKGMSEALIEKGAQVEVISFVSWIPKIMGAVSKDARRFIECPPEYTWGPLHVLYPRWLFYEFGPLRRQYYKAPYLQTQFGWLTAKRRLEKYVDANRPDVIFCIGTLPNGYLAWKLKQKYGIPYVASDFDFDEVADCMRLPRRRGVYAPVMRDAAANVAVSNRMANDMRAVSPGCNALPIYNGVAPLKPELFATPRPTETQGRLVVFCACTFYHRKLVHVLLEAFARALKNHPNAILRLAGDGAERGKIDAAIDQLGIREKVQRLGYIDRERVFQEMAWCDFFALVGRDEPFATVYLEAIAAGKPVIWSNDGGINDVLINGEDGFGVPPNDVNATAIALEKLISDSSERQRMSDNAKKHFAEKINDDSFGRDLMVVLQKAVEDSKHGREG